MDEKIKNIVIDTNYSDLVKDGWRPIINKSNFDNEKKSEDKNEENPESLENQNQEGKENEISEKSEVTVEIPKNTEFHYNIQIHLPATNDISVYNAIFKSLKENLLMWGVKYGRNKIETICF